MAIAQDLSDLPRADSRPVDGWAPDTEPRYAQVFAELRARGIGSPERHEWAATVLGREVTSFKEISEVDGARLLDWFDAHPVGVEVVL